MINSRDIKDLHPKVQVLATKFIGLCKAEGIDVIITSTYRDNESQKALYAQGRTKPGKKVTNAPAGSSFHNYRLAFDFVPIVNGKAVYKDLSVFRRCGEIGKSVGLSWAGDWIKFKELAHLQFTDGLTLVDLKAGKHLA
jgi:peptidoglycan L-alanyl-D-glutamate endopeptidase CwlK